jgi:hypothetical protein
MKILRRQPLPLSKPVPEGSAGLTVSTGDCIKAAVLTILPVPLARNGADESRRLAGVFQTTSKSPWKIGMDRGFYGLVPALAPQANGDMRLGYLTALIGNNERRSRAAASVWA